MPGDRPHVWAAAPDGQPYFNAGEHLAWPKGATEQSVDLALPRGVLIRGKVTEEGTGQPVADAMVNFASVPDPPAGARIGPDESRWLVRVRRRAAPRPPVGPGPRRGLPAPGDQQRAVLARPGGRQAAVCACLPPLRPQAGRGDPGNPHHAAAGRHGPVRLIGPDGQPARDVRVYSRAVLGPAPTPRSGVFPGPDEVARRGHFEVHGLDPETDVPVHFLQPDRKLGATVRVSGKMAAQGPVTVRLEPCGLAMARLVGPDGKPVTGQPRGVSVTMVVTPGPPFAPRR